MREAATQFVPADNQADFVLRVDEDIPDRDVNWLLGILEQSVRSGRRYTDGETIEVGSAFFMLKEGAGGLHLEEPDMISFPMRFVRSASNSLRRARLQKDVMESYAVVGELAQPSLLQSVVIGSDVSPVSPVFIARGEPCGTDCGWFIGKLDSSIDYNAVGNISAISVYQALVDFKDIGGWLGLPSGCTVVLGDPDGRISQDDRALLPKPGTFIADVVRAARSN